MTNLFKTCKYHCARLGIAEIHLHRSNLILSGGSCTFFTWSGRMVLELRINLSLVNLRPPLQGKATAPISRPGVSNRWYAHRQPCVDSPRGLVEMWWPNARNRMETYGNIQIDWRKWGASGGYPKFDHLTIQRFAWFRGFPWRNPHMSTWYNSHSSAKCLACGPNTQCLGIDTPMITDSTSGCLKLQWQPSPQIADKCGDRSPWQRGRHDATWCDMTGLTGLHEFATKGLFWKDGMPRGLDLCTLASLPDLTLARLRPLAASL